MHAQDIEPEARLDHLDTAGYAVVRSFLTDAEAAAFEADYVAGSDQRASYEVRAVSPRARSAIDPKLTAMARAVARASTVRVDVVSSGVFGSAYFTTESDVGSPWHQDAVSYYAYQNHHDYLNFYIPIVKPERDRSNLCVVPFDVLEARSPEHARRLRGTGATRFVVKRGTTIVHDNNAGGIRGVLPYALDDIAVTPQLGRGDLLLLRGDVIHRTEDTRTRRVAVSIRMMNRQSVVRRHELVRGGLLKAFVMTRGRRDFQQLFDAFAATGRDQLTIGELEASTGRTAARPGSQLGFLTFLLWNRLRDRLSSRPKGARS
ncbi:MAG TPA: phytanoyl-CoA dioxygenase family protein [Kofleriaceae bacterium]|jgi:hypothetical protein|nr:phytanoyl-CoA dioxygenase family protein [Kofleriaceae bacterium]